MRVITPDNETIELGTVETAPTIGITDYSRRVTDDYGVTTVVPRAFSRRMEVRLAVAFDDVDALQRQLAAMRATAATWIADERFASLSIVGYYKDFEIDHAVPPLAYCRLTIEGLAESDSFVDAGGDPAAGGERSTLQLLDPIVVDGSVLTASNVAETDAPAWSAGATYALGAQVILTSTHRIYESAIAGNVGNDPAGVSGKWLDVGPTNRWAMFDQALGTTTNASSVIDLSLKPATAVSALAVLDTNAATVRVRAPGYDRTQAVPASGKALFLDMAIAAGANVLVSITPASGTPMARTWDDGAQWNDAAAWRDALAGGDGTVLIGTLLLGALKTLGVTEASPTVGIIDFSKKETDDFGEVTVVPRAWAKRMATKALIRSDAVDLVAGRIAAVRARPSLWIGQDGLDALTIYGFFKDFGIEVGETVSKLSLSIEGLSTAAKIQPLTGSGTVNWPDVVDSDPAHPKPTDGADKTSENTAKDTAAIGGTPTADFLAAYAAAKARQDELENVTIPAVNGAVTQANAAIAAARQAADQAVADANARIASARSILDQAIVDLAAEVSRAQGADEQLSQRIDTISATGGYDDTSVRAAIQSVDTARADDKRAIGQRVDSVVTDYKDRDSATNARITQTITGYSDADRAIGQRIDAVTTDYQGLNSNTNTRITSEVRALSDADQAIGERIDTLIAQGGGGSEGVDTVARAEVSRVEQASITRDNAISQRVDTVQASFTKGLGFPVNMKSAGQWTSNELAEAAAPFAPDDGRFVVNSEGFAVFATGTGENVILAPVASFKPTAGRRYRCTWKVRKSVAATDTDMLIYPGFIVRNVDGSVGYPGYSISQDQLSASAADYTSVTYEWTAPAGIAWVRPRLHLNHTGSNGRLMVAGLVVEDLTDITASNARIDQVATSAADANRAVAELSNSVTARFSGVSGDIAASATNITRAYTAADQALAGRQTIIESSTGSGAGILNANPAFAVWPDGQRLPNGWTDWGSTANLYAGRSVSGRVDTPWCINTNQTAPNVDVGFVQTLPSIRPAGWYVIDVEAELIAGLWQGAGITVSGVWNLDFSGLQDLAGDISDAKLGLRRWTLLFQKSDDAYGNFHCMQGWSNFGRGAAQKVVLWRRASIRPANDGEIKAGKADAALPGLTARIKASEDTLIDLPNRYAATNRVAVLESQVIFAADSGLQRTVNARIEDRATAIADAKAGAVAQTVQTLQTDYNGTKATVSQQAGAIAGLNGKAAAYVRVVADAGNGRAALSLWSDQYGGAWSLTGDGLIDGNLTVNGTITSSKIADNAVTAGATYLGSSASFSSTAATNIGSLSYAGSGGRASVTVSGVVTLGPNSAAGTRLQIYVSLSGTIIVGPIYVSASRGVPIPFSFTTVATVSGAQTVTLTAQATNAAGSGDPHIVDSPVIILTEFKK